MSKRNIRKPQGFGGKELEGFFMVSMQDSATIIFNKLTGSQIRLWHYLNMINPFADYTKDGEKIFRSIPSPQEIAIKLGLNPETVTKDMRKLKRLGLFDFRVTDWQSFNNSANHAKQESNRLKRKKAESPKEEIHKTKKAESPKEEIHKTEGESPETQSGQGGGRNNPPQGLNNLFSGLNNLFPGLNNPPHGINNLPQRLNNPSVFLGIPWGQDFSVPQTLQTIQTDLTFLYSPYCGGEKEKKDKQETGQEDYGTEGNVSTNTQIVENNCSSSQKINQETQVSTLDLNEDKNYGGCSVSEGDYRDMVQGSSTEVETNNEGNAGAIAVVKPQLRSNQLNPVQERNWQWLPDGAWKTSEGKLDPHFQEWFAKIFFMKEFGYSDIYLAKANVLAYFKNDLDRLAFRWEQYHEEYLAKLKNTEMLLDHDVKIPEERRKNTINRVRAIQPVASEQSVSTKPTPVNSNLESLESIVNSVTAPQVNPQNILNPAVNPVVNSGVEELEAEVIEASVLDDPWSESEETESSALTQIEVKDTQIEVRNTQIEVKDTQIEVRNTQIEVKDETQIQETSFTPKYVKIDNSDCPDPEVISVVYRDFTGIAEQMEKERREAPPINPLAKAMIEDFTTIISGKPVDRPVGERIEIINYALSHSGRNKYFFAQAQQFINQGWKVDFNDEGEPLYIHADSDPVNEFYSSEFTDSENEDVVIDSDIYSDEESNSPDSIETLPNSNSDTESKDLKNSTSPKRKYSKLVSNLMSKAEKLNEILKIECARKSRHFLAQVQEFINLGWMVDYNDEGEPIEVYQF